MQFDQLKRREFITLIGGAAVAWPLAARAQERERMRRIGVLMNGAATEANLQSYVAAFAQGLRQLGWIEGQSIRIDVRWNAGDAALAKTYAAQLIGLAPDVILAPSTANLEIVRQATNTIPIVFLLVSDPLAQGFVASYPKPGGNITGFSGTDFTVGGKWLDLLKEITPGLTRVAVMFNPDTSQQSKFFMRSIEAAGSSLGVQSLVVPVRADADIEVAFESLARASGGGLILTPDAFTNLRHRLIADLANRHRLPVISSQLEFPKNGGLMAYGVIINVLDQYRRAAGYVDRILKGERPADLPVQRSDKYTLALNLKSAKALGLTVPPTLLALADEVIE
jgi:putative tryptophan/tyrosine transport system substrate-binding protein